MTRTMKLAMTTALASVLATSTAMAGSHENNALEDSVFSDEPAVTETTESVEAGADNEVDSSSVETDSMAETDAPASDPEMGYKDADTAETEAESGSDSGDANMIAGSIYSEEELNAFVAAAVDVGDMRVEYAQRVAEAQDQAAAEALIAEARTEMMRVVEDAEAITIEDYIAIGTAAQTNPKLAEWLTAAIEEEVRQTATPEAEGSGDG